MTTSRLSALAGVLALGVAALGIPALRSSWLSPESVSVYRAARGVPLPAPYPSPQATYVSTSGVPHADLADVEVLRAGRGWDPGDPNGINRDWRRAISHVWGQVAAEGPDAVFATGDMVRGMWGVDAGHTGIFGPVDTYAHRVAAVRNAGRVYERTLRRTYARHGLTVFPGMGDHEMGGLPHSGLVRRGTFHARALRVWVSTWSRVFGHHPYYHVRLPGGVELWTLEPFRRDHDGGVSARLSHRELRWLRSSLRRSTARWRIVQSEIPPYSSPGFVGRHSSQTRLLDARRVVRVLARGGVDLLLCAEFHRVDALQVRGVPEIIHGGNLVFGRANYLVLDVYAHRLELTSKKMARAPRDWTHRLWAPSRRRPPWVIHEQLGARVAGLMTITHDGVVSASGDLRLR